MLKEMKWSISQIQEYQILLVWQNILINNARPISIEIILVLDGTAAEYNYQFNKWLHIYESSYWDRNI